MFACTVCNKYISTYVVWIVFTPAFPTHSQYMDDPVLCGKLTEIMQHVKGRTKSWDLGTLLIKPVQRILKYPLLLLQLKKVCRELLGFVGVGWDLLGFVGICWDLLGFVGICWDLLGSVGICICRRALIR